MSDRVPCSPLGVDAVARRSLRQSSRRGWILTFALLLFGWSSAVEAAKPEDVFKGKIILTKDRLPSRFSSESAFVQAIKSKQIDKVWPKEEKGADEGSWVLEYIAFFARPLNDSEITVKFFEITHGEKRYVASDPQYTREKGSRVFGANITVAKPEFDVNKRYLMNLESGGRVIATTTFWLRGKGAQYSGKVEFSDSETKQK